MAYAQDVLEVTGDESSSDTEDEGSSRRQKKKKSGHKSHADPLLTLPDGTVQLPNILDMPAPEKKNLMRAFLTHHYRKFYLQPNENADSESGLACGKQKATVPWGHIADHLYEYIDKRYFPSNILFKEPTKLPSVQVGEILHFWRRRQQNDPQDIFRFAQWKDNDGLLQPSRLNLDTDEELTEGAVQAEAILPECHQQAGTGAVVFLTYSVCINSAA